MHTKRKILTGVLTGTLLLSNCPFAIAATSHFNDASVVGTTEAWSAWKEDWKKTATDFTKISIAPGANESELNFAWYAPESATPTPVVYFGTSRTNLKTFQGTAGKVDEELTAGESYQYNHVTVTDVQPNTTYYYAVKKNGLRTSLKTYKTGDFDKVQILVVGDPQIGASKGQPQGNSKLVPDVGVANTAARNDSFTWNRTLNIATAENPELDFILSAGDQINKTGKPKEEEFAAFLNATALSSLPIAACIGNHDSLNPDYKYHFNNPNATENGTTQAGGDYYYSYGDGLFIVLNTNNYNVAEHEDTIKKAIASDADAKWRVVTIHQDIYGAGLNHSDTDGMILRTQLTPIFDKYDVDVVLQGHDHTYSRSKLLYSDGKTHGAYKFQLNADKTNYDWDHAYDTVNNSLIPLEPEATDSIGQSKLNAFTKDNQCYKVVNYKQNTVKNPKGVLYITANSASGSKFYELTNVSQNFIAKRSQNWLPSYSVINMDEDSFSIDTYQITEDGKTERIDDTFTIQKNIAPKTLEETQA